MCSVRTWRRALGPDARYYGLAGPETIPSNPGALVPLLDYEDRGSGKTLVLARRAAHALIRGRDVLLLGYNITLWHYVRDFVARAVRTALLKDYAYTKDERRAMREDELKRRARAKLDRRCTAAREESPFPQVDALLTDEGLDWCPA